MMSDIVIRVENLGKLYRIGRVQEGYPTLRNVLANLATAPLRALRHHRRSAQPKETIWALKNVSFEVGRGEVVGIIGRNGAGKTTLLKILSRITEPTEGEIKIRGRVGSLLEVGTGFHPELTGRENIYLNGAILGMKKREIDRKFDEIVAFTEVEKFIDTPVKHYSSGMYVRLAFAVAAHLEPEILLVDEVLAVGDIAFQKKCLGKMGDVAKGGRTVLLVSHDMGAIRGLCGNAIWLDNGQIVKTGSAYEVVRGYEKKMIELFDESFYVVERNLEEAKNLGFYFSRVEMFNTEGEHTTIFRYGDDLVLHVELAGELAGGVFSAEFYIYNELGQLVSVGASGPYHGKYFNRKVRRIRIEIGPLTITGGKYRISLSLVAGGAGAERTDTWESAIAFTITECQPFETSWEIPASREGVCVLQQSFYEIG